MNKNAKSLIENMSQDAKNKQLSDRIAKLEAENESLREALIDAGVDPSKSTVSLSPFPPTAGAVEDPST